MCAEQAHPRCYVVKRGFLVYVPGMHRPITPQPQSQQQQSTSSDYEDYTLHTGSPARSNMSTPHATSPMMNPMGREAIHSSITAFNLSVNPLTRGTASLLPISRLASNSPSPSFTDSISKGTPEKSLTRAGSLARNPRHSLPPLVYESAGSPHARQPAPVVSSILRSRSPDQSTLMEVNIPLSKHRQEAALWLILIHNRLPESSPWIVVNPLVHPLCLIHPLFAAILIGLDTPLHLRELCRLLRFQVSEGQHNRCSSNHHRRRLLRDHSMSP